MRLTRALKTASTAANTHTSTTIDGASTITKKPFVWGKIGFHTACDTSAGEISLSDSPGKVSTIEVCTRTCEISARCRAITFFKSRWCSHFSTMCTRTKWTKGATAMHLISAPKVTIEAAISTEPSAITAINTAESSPNFVSTARNTRTSTVAAEGPTTTTVTMHSATTARRIVGECDCACSHFVSFVSHNNIALNRSMNWLSIPHALAPYFLYTGILSTSVVLFVCWLAFLGITGPYFEVIGFKECNEDAGEVLLDQFSGSFKFCGESCVDREGCQSLAYFSNLKRCNLYRTRCSNNVASKHGFSLKKNGEIIESTTAKSTATTEPTTTAHKTATSQPTLTTTEPTTTTEFASTTEPTTSMQSARVTITPFGMSWCYIEYLVCLSSP